jgi:nitroreductase
MRRFQAQPFTKRSSILSSQEKLETAMNKFFHSTAMLYIMAGLLVLVFFLPDLIGPLPALICGAAVIGFGFYVYNLWCKDPADEKEQQTETGLHQTRDSTKEMENTMLLELLRERRSVRKFTDQKIEEEKLDILIEAVLRSPSSRGLSPWEFVVVREEETIGALARSKTHGSSFLAGAPLAIVVCAHPAKSDVWVEDASIASLLLHLCAADLGLGSCWIQIRNRQHDGTTDSETYVKHILGLKPDMTVEAIVAIGYSAEVKPGHAAETLLYDRVSYENYGSRR